MMKLKYGYDIECLQNVFTLTAINADKPTSKLVFEISPRRNDIKRLVKWVNWLVLKDAVMIGFNSVHYDYPMLHFLMKQLSVNDNAKLLTKQLYEKSQRIFQDSYGPFGNKFAHTIWDDQCIVRQIDLFKVHHFDNKARMTSLKRLEFNMRMDNIEEFELPFDQPIKKASEIVKLVNYNDHDVVATNLFFKHSKSNVDFRTELGKKSGKYVMNYNDTKIGEDYVIQKIKDEIGEDVLYNVQKDEYDNFISRKKKITKRTVMPIKDFLFDYIEFERPEFQAVYDKMKAMKMFVINGKFHWNENDDYTDGLERVKELKAEVKGVLKKDRTEHHEIIFDKIDKLSEQYSNDDIRVHTDGVEFVYGKGGLHASLNNSVSHTTKDRMIIDIDVTSFYPMIGIANKLFPEHLTEKFCDIYQDVFNMRASYPKGTTENAMLKLALNGSYGKTNSEYSPLCDPLYTVSTTLNGQLLLTMLWEYLAKIKNITLIQVNTDGVTFEIDNNNHSKTLVKRACRKWEKLTGLELESAVYSRMWVRDGNNYIAEYKGGKLKQKGAYVYSSLFHSHDCDPSGVQWHKNHSMLVVQKAVEAQLVNGIDARKFIIEHDDIYDFFLCTNVNRQCKLMLGDGYVPAEKYKGKVVAKAELGMLNRQVQRNSRYIISNSDDKFTKVMKGLRGSPDDRYIGINVDWNVSVYNRVVSTDVDDYDINYEFYIKEAQKLLQPFEGK